jgi:hypothetical protein
LAVVVVVVTVVTVVTIEIPGIFGPWPISSNKWPIHSHFSGR